MIKVLALDPGITTGIAFGTIHEGTMYFAADQAELKCLGLWDLISSYDPNIIVCESFEFRQGKQRGNLELYSRNLIGVIQLYHEMFKTKLVMQNAAQGKTFYTNEKLKQEGSYIKGKDHARDAIRHLLYWYAFGAGFEYNESGFVFNPTPLLLGG